jgi:chorismate-pyruvate lyase
VLAEDDDELSLCAGGEVHDRRALLRGAESGTPLVLGVSRIVTHRLPRPARAALIGGDDAIGLVLSTNSTRGRHGAVTAPRSSSNSI